MRARPIHATAVSFLLTLSAAFFATAAGAGDLALAGQTLHGDATLVKKGRAAWVESGGTSYRLILPGAIEPEALAATGGGWYLSGVDRKSDPPRLLLFAGTGGATRLLPAPATTGALIVAPRLLAGETLRGLAWLEGNGDQKLAVRVALRQGDRWGKTETIAPPGPGSQLALTGAVLDDGTPLLAWSAFDGEDDEILWSRHDGSGWSAPARVATDNAVPDVTPSLLAAPGGALLTWSRYDGNDYRVELARFTGDGFTEPVVIGEPGSVLPTLALDRGVAHVLYRTADPATWTVAELAPPDTAEGAKSPIVRRAAVPRETEARPILGHDDAGETVLRWPALDATAPLSWSDQPTSAQN